jgi:hypothetical protein
MYATIAGAVKARGTGRADIGHLLDPPKHILRHTAISRKRCPTSAAREVKITLPEKGRIGKFAWEPLRCVAQKN